MRTRSRAENESNNGSTESPESGAKAHESDVVIVGAGPAGCVLAYLLARSGVDVVLLEREADLDREFRGYFFQPLVPRLFSQMGILEPLLNEVPHEKRSRLSIGVFGRTYPIFDFEILRESPEYGLFLEQPPLLRFLVDRAREYDGFEFHDRTTVVDLVREGDAVVGVRAHNRARNEQWTIRARLVVGADGRHSTVRNRLGIDPNRREADLRVLWCKLPAAGIDPGVIGRIEADGVLGYVPLGEDVQLGLLLDRDEYPEIRNRGIEHLRRRMTAIDPTLAEPLEAHLVGFEECTVLDPSPGLCKRWTRDGALLIGDAAHIANPFGAQGNSLAVQDAVVAHPHVVRALRDRNGPIPSTYLREFERRRRSDVEAVMRTQWLQTRAIELYVRSVRYVPTILAMYLSWALAAVSCRIPALRRRSLARYAFGSGDVTVATKHFTDE